MITLKKIQDGATKRLDDIMKRASDTGKRTFLNRNAMAWYRNAQRKRWMTENESEGGPRWKDLNADYEKRKRKLFAGFPGAGKAKLIASGTLLQSTIGPGKGFQKVVTSRELIIVTTVPYAKFVDEIRTFSLWGDESIERLKKHYKDFLMRGDRGPATG